MGKITPFVRIAEARTRMRELERLSGQSSRRFDEIIGRFELFAERGFGVDQLNDVTQELIERFIAAKGNDGPPSTSTMHLRRAVVRLLFRVAHDELGFEGDPTHRIYLPPRTMLTARPLTDEEVALGRSFSLHTLTSTRQPAAWALSEATATTGELPHITTDDLDLDNPNGPRVWIHGSRKRQDRWGFLDDWSAQQLERRAAALRNTKHLVYQGAGEEEVQQISCCIAVKETMIRAGLAKEPDVRPASLVAWAGCVVLEESERIEQVARRLGIRSLDSAARFIGFNW